MIAVDNTFDYLLCVSSLIYTITMLDETKKSQIRDFLIGLVKKKSATGYVKLNEKVNLGLNFSDETQMNELYDALDEISAKSFKDNKVFLGIVIVNKMRNRPSPRFYKGIEKIIGAKIEDTDDFFEQEREKLYGFYTSNKL